MDKPGKANLLLEGIENKLTPSLKTIVLMDSYGSNLSERGKKCGVEIISMKAMEVSHLALPTSLQGFPEVILAQMWHPVWPQSPNSGWSCKRWRAEICVSLLERRILPACPVLIHHILQKVFSSGALQRSHAHSRALTSHANKCWEWEFQIQAEI